jgi:hypothetical protein
MKTNNTNNRTQKNWDRFAIIVTILTSIIVIGGGFQILTNL